MSGPAKVRSPLRPYVTRIALEWADSEPDRRWRAYDATTCFVDISGFTALSERLARQGRIGAEELTRVLNDVFTELLGVAYGQRGTLLKFGGDALLLVFEGADHAERACWAAMGMRAALRRVGRVATDAGAVRLRMSVGVHSGTFHLFRIGTTHNELIITGPAASATTRMEAAAGPGEILVSGATAAAVDPILLGDAKAGGRLLRERRRLRPGPGPFPPPRGDAQTVAREVPVALRRHLEGGVAEPEHRTASVGFVKFSGTDGLLGQQGPDAVADALHALVSAVQEAIEVEQIAFLASDIDEDGGKLILAAGVPLVHEDDEGRLLRALRAVIDTATGSGLPLAVRAGVNRGHVFAADVGGVRRRTYTVMGDTVNLAARLMAKAPVGHLYSTSEVIERSRTTFETTALEPFTVKGKSTPVHALDIGAAIGTAGAGASREALPFAGRDAEMATLTVALDEVRAGLGGRTVEVVGAVGAGKSRLARELTARAADFRAVVVRGELFGTTTPYLPVRLLLRQLLGAAGSDVSGLEESLTAAVAASAPHLEPWVPLVGTVLALDLPATPAVAALEPEFRRERREAVTAELLLALLGDHVLLVIEDAHWLDSPSADLLRRIGVEAATRSWLVVTTTRPPGRAEPGTTAIELGPIDDVAAREMVLAATDDAPLRPHELELVVDRAAGNPLFVEEILRARRATGDVTGLPESLDAVATTAIDVLPPLARRLLRYASVLGMTFRRDVLVDVLADDVSAIDQDTRTLLRDHLIADGPDLLRFRSRVLRDAAYEGLSYRRRQDLHARAGRSFEERYADRLDGYAELLSIHFGAAGHHEKAWRYARRAGDLARAAYANVEAASQYERAVEAGRRLDLDLDELSAVLEDLGDARTAAGIYEAAMDSFQRAERLRAGQPTDQARLLLKRSHAASYISPLDAQVRLVRRGYRRLDGLTGPEVGGLKARILAREAIIRRSQGRVSQALALCLQALDEARQADERRAMADAYGLLDALYLETGRLDMADNLQRALAIYRQLGDRHWEGNTLMHLGIIAYHRGDWAEAGRLYPEGAEALTDAGSLTQAAFAQVNQAELLIDQGRLDEAEPLLAEARRVTRAASYHDGTAFASQELGRLAARRGDHDTADEYFAEARVLYEAIGDHTAILELHLDQSEALLARGNLAGADVLLATTRAQAGQGGLGLTLDWIEALCRAAQGEHDESIELLTRALADPDAASPIERLRLLDAVVDLDPPGLEPELGAWREERDRLTRQLGIVAPPWPPLGWARAGEAAVSR